MTDRTPQQQPEANANDLSDRLAKVRNELSRQSQAAHKKRKSFIIFGAIATVLCFLALWNLTAMAFQLDANALTQVGRLEVEKHLPQGRASLAHYLKSESSGVVRQVLESLVGFLPSLRSIVVNDVDKKLTAVTTEGELLLAIQMEQSVGEVKKKLEAEFPGLSDVEKFEKLVSVVADDFTTNVQLILDQLYPKYVAEMERVRSFLDELSKHDDYGLTKKERTQKELIRTLLRLIVREQGDAGLIPARR